MSALSSKFNPGGATLSAKILDQVMEQGPSAAWPVMGGGGGFQVTGDFLATICFEQSDNGKSGWKPRRCYPDDGGCGCTETTVPGIWGFAKDGEFVRLKVEDYKSGTVNCRYADLEAGELPFVTIAVLADFELRKADAKKKDR